MNRIVKSVLRRLHKYFDSPVKYARYLGVMVGDNTMIGQDVHWPSEPYLISIGAHCQVTNGCWFHTHGGANVVRRLYPEFDVFGKIVVEDWAYIGAGAQIMPGVTISEGTLVAAGSVVTKTTAPYTVVGGNPARVICTVEEYYKRNMKYNVNSKHQQSGKKSFLLNLPPEKFISK